MNPNTLDLLLFRNFLFPQNLDLKFLLSWIEQDLEILDNYFLYASFIMAVQVRNFVQQPCKACYNICCMLKLKI
jgi:hypothetical protein